MPKVISKSIHWHPMMPKQISKSIHWHTIMPRQICKHLHWRMMMPNAKFKAGFGSFLMFSILIYQYSEYEGTFRSYK